jgi:hypothetical protein
LGVAFGCGHNPIQHKGFQGFRNDVLRAMDPDWVVNLGDWHDAAFASRWENEEDWDSEDEFRELANDARQINESAPNARRILLEGNHDDNVSQPGRLPKSVRKSLLARRDSVLGEHIGDWATVPYGHDKFYRIGQITFQHGCQTNLNAERDQTLLYGVPYGLHVSAHTHRPIPPTMIVLPGKVPVYGAHFCNVGTGADWERMRYIQRSNHALWGRGVLIFEVNCKQRRSAFATRQWNADLLIHSMANERAMR